MVAREADRMLDLGFIDAVKALISKMPKASRPAPDLNSRRERAFARLGSEALSEVGVETAPECPPKAQAPDLHVQRHLACRGPRAAMRRHAPPCAALSSH